MPRAKPVVKTPSRRVKARELLGADVALDKVADADIAGAATAAQQAVQAVEYYGPKHIVSVTVNSRADQKSDNIHFELSVH